MNFTPSFQKSDIGPISCAGAAVKHFATSSRNFCSQLERLTKAFVSATFGLLVARAARRVFPAFSQTVRNRQTTASGNASPDA
ncbi:hypothetical protein [Paraburkholderia sp. JPY465]|uniref:hypothetical protein n=1 Tax=Paraburkholderia sp. JPY465 TaxID=3042285 RepID=UPI003D1F146A